MPGYDLHPGVDATYQFPPEVRAAIVAMTELQTALTQVYDNARNRANHTGTQLAATISDFTTAVRAVAASETALGTAERATTAEVQTMTDTTRYISPAGLAAASVSAATANRIIRRDSAGRAQVVSPSAAGDIATKGYVDTTTNGRGTTAERDAFYGAVGTVALQVALANLVPLWYNTTTRRWETYYAVNGSTGLTVPGVTGIAAGWYPAPAMAVDWGGKSGIASKGVSRNVWSRGIDGGGVVKATLAADSILLGAAGIYEIEVRQRGGASGPSDYSTLALNGNRTEMEKLAGGLDATPISAVWGHDHPAVNNNYGTSYFLGPLPAGSLVTAGPPTTSGDTQVGTTATAGYLQVKRIG